jgi:hypothetical protein
LEKEVSNQSGKGSKVANNFRTPQWEDSKLWKKKAKNQRIFEENKHLIEGSNVEMVEGDSHFSLEGITGEYTGSKNPKIDWGDGTVNKEKSHIYKKPGTYTVEVKGE